MSEDCVSFLSGLLSVNEKERLGFNGNDQVKKHPWLIDFPWDSLINKTFTVPYIPDITKGIFENIFL